MFIHGKNSALIKSELVDHHQIEAYRPLLVRHCPAHQYSKSFTHIFMSESSLYLATGQVCQVLLLGSDTGRVDLKTRHFEHRHQTSHRISTPWHPAIDISAVTLRLRILLDDILSCPLSLGGDDSGTLGAVSRGKWQQQNDTA
nr:hypothetical protein CFP56_77668 [Quercus suber]